MGGTGLRWSPLGRSQFGIQFWYRPIVGMPIAGHHSSWFGPCLVWSTLGITDVLLVKLVRKACG